MNYYEMMLFQNDVKAILIIASVLAALIYGIISGVKKWIRKK